MLRKQECFESFKTSIVIPDQPRTLRNLLNLSSTCLGNPSFVKNVQFPDVLLNSWQWNWGLMISSLLQPSRLLSQFAGMVGKILSRVFRLSWDGAPDWGAGAKYILWLVNSRGPFYYNFLTLITAWICHHMSNKVWDEITYPFPNFNNWTIEVWEWINDFISHFIMDVIT